MLGCLFHNIYCQAAAAVCVGMGSFSDPLDAQGLAHFLGEYQFPTMMFMPYSVLSSSIFFLCELPFKFYLYILVMMIFHIIFKEIWLLRVHDKCVKARFMLKLFCFYERSFAQLYTKRSQKYCGKYTYKNAWLALMNYQKKTVRQQHSGDTLFYWPIFLLRRPWLMETISIQWADRNNTLVYRC